MTLRFTPGARAVTLIGRGVYVFRERSTIRLRGEIYERVAPLLDGTRTRDEVARALGTTDAAEVYYAIQQLIDRGYVCHADAAMPERAAGFWTALGVDAATAAARFADTRVAINAVGAGAVDVGTLTSALAAHGIRVDEAAALRVVVTDDYLQPELADINRRAQQSGRPWLLCKPAGSVVWIGPLFRPGHSACWECLAQRLRRHRLVEAYVQRRTGADGPLVLPPGTVRASEQVALHLAALQVAKAVAGGRADGCEPGMVTIDLHTLAAAHHVVVRRPQCPACGVPLDPAREPQPVTLQPQPAWFSADGGYRSVTPEDTFERYRHHISPVTGVIAELQAARLPAGSGPSLHVYRAGRVSIPVDTPDLLRHLLRRRAAGKGATRAQAMTSAVCESLERYSGTFHGDEPRVRASYASLGDRAVHPNRCMLFSDRQFATARPWHPADAPNSAVPAPFDEDAVVDWSPAWSLTARSFRYLPTAYCYYGHPRLDEVRHNPPDSNGCAAGNSLEEAIVQGFLELVERDAVAIWWYNRVPRPGIDLDSFSDPALRVLRRAYAGLQREAWALDLTSDLGIPTFAAISRSAGSGAGGTIFGFGAHVEARLALLRAFTEMNQSLPGVPVSLDDEPYLRPAADVPLRSQRDFPSAAPADLRDEILRCQALAGRHGLDVLVLDQTRPDVGMPVVKVIVPGLRHFWARFAPGRLYDVPVTLGWLPLPRTESELNPVAMFL
jgi:ribosomal protein S12 methylthiotransferase accessory factor